MKGKTSHHRKTSHNVRRKTRKTGNKRMTGGTATRSRSRSRSKSPPQSSSNLSGETQIFDDMKSKWGLDHRLSHIETVELLKAIVAFVKMHRENLSEIYEMFEDKLQHGLFFSEHPEHDAIYKTFVVNTIFILHGISQKSERTVFESDLVEHIDLISTVFDQTARSNAIDINKPRDSIINEGKRERIKEIYKKHTSRDGEEILFDMAQGRQSKINADASRATYTPFHISTSDFPLLINKRI
jgi:hypothetical protein